VSFVQLVLCGVRIRPVTISQSQTVTGGRIDDRIENLEKAHRIYIEKGTMASKSSKRTVSSSEDGSLSESEAGPDDEKTIPFLR
jgi:hypothetical protein